MLIRQGFARIQLREERRLKEHLRPLTTRIYRYKKSSMDFFCPLCRTERSFTTNFRLTPMNFLQMSIIAVVLTGLFFPWLGLKGGFIFFVIWGAFDFSSRVNFRKEVPCPHCGFDASWYKRDVKVARKLVHEFWNHEENRSTKEGSETVDS